MGLPSRKPPIKCHLVLINRHLTGVMSVAGGHRINRHWHQEHQIVYPASGVLAVTTDEGTWIAPPNRALWIPSGAGHEHRFYGPTQFHSVAFDPGVYPVELASPTVIAVSPLLRELIITCSDPGDLPEEEVARLRVVLIDQLRHSPEQALRLPTPHDERLAEACALVEEDLTQVWTVADLGRRVGASERTLTRLFRTDMGMTYPQWRTQDPPPSRVAATRRGSSGDLRGASMRLGHTERIHRRVSTHARSDTRNVRRTRHTVR